MKTFLVILSVILAAFAGAAHAESQSITFDQNWKEQGFLRFFSNEYDLRGRQLDIVSDGTVSVLWRPLHSALGGARQASWDWNVTEGVRPTDLTRRGGDDRNLAIYFVYVDPETAKGLKRTSARKLLGNPNTKALVYVWGGRHPKREILPSPYSAGLKSKILRIEQTGSFAEKVNLDQDFTVAFENAPRELVGLAITADSDDTDSLIRASIRDLRIQ